MQLLQTFYFHSKFSKYHFIFCGHALRHDRFSMPGLCGKRRLVSGCAFGFQHFHHLVGGGGGRALLEVAGNHKDGVPSAYFYHAIRAAGGSGGASVGGSVKGSRPPCRNNRGFLSFLCLSCHVLPTYGQRRHGWRTLSRRRLCTRSFPQ